MFTILSYDYNEPRRKPFSMEWLVSDQHGFFAMGTREGIRSRKYHGFLSGIAGRLEKNLLAHLDLSCHGAPLWTHAYNSPQQPVFHPAQTPRLEHFQAQPWPSWSWDLTEGRLDAQLTALDHGGFELKLTWASHTSIVAPVVVRPLWAMRPLHALGAQNVVARMEGQSLHFRGHDSHDDVWIFCDRAFDWRPTETWYRNFLYTEEFARGYPHNEDLYCAGQFELTLQHGESVRLRLHSRASHAAGSDLHATMTRPLRSALPATAHALSDFVLYDPPGIVAGFPWFGEWGRDTFIALPGIVAGLHHHDPDIVSWGVSVLERWSAWIDSDGMIPNLITLEGPQWESADGTLWWTHALASLWALGAAKPEFGLLELLPRKFARTLHNAIDAIKSGRHSHLSRDGEGFLNVTSPHATWMDARLDGRAATPRLGRLPEISALWFQARCLHELWTRQHGHLLREEATKLLEFNLEPERPNFVFLYSIPFAPCLFAQSEKAQNAAARDATRLAEKFVTPMGLRTLSPDAPAYNACYRGGAVERDSCYHQGPAWGWLRGHYDMATPRFANLNLSPDTNAASYVAPEFLSTIPGHYAELFDAEPPYQLRGAPAQAWSSACAAEAVARRELKVDDVLIRIIEGHFR